MQQWPGSTSTAARMQPKPHTRDATHVDLLDILNDPFYGEELIDPLEPTTKASTKHDQRDMFRMGKKQELKVRF